MTERRKTGLGYIDNIVPHAGPTDPIAAGCFCGPDDAAPPRVGDVVRRELTDAKGHVRTALRAIEAVDVQSNQRLSCAHNSLMGALEFLDHALHDIGPDPDEASNG